tara:strand:+ start:462 stop:1583 length:1122 start_codon:yes stop_codon:yes gene_type:complete
MKPFKISEPVWKGLLKPLDGDKPCGRPLLYEPVYDEIRDARSHEDENLPQGIWKRDLKKADWSKVEKLCIEALTDDSKDLQIAAWLSESWLQQYGLKGFAKGLELIRRLSATFWDDLHPELNKDDPEYRLAPYLWLDDKLLDRLNLLPVTSPSDQGGIVYHFEDWDRAQHQEQLNRLSGNKDKKAGKTLSLKEIKQSQSLTPTPFYKEMRDSLKICLDELQHIETLITSHEPDYPGFLSHLRTKLQSLSAFVNVILSARREIDSKTNQENNSDADSQSGALISMPSGPISSREQAYQLLAEAADFLARLEPHSPTPYLVRRAISWGSMSLVDLLDEIVNDPNDLRQIMQLLGQQSKNPNGTNGNGGGNGGGPS